MPLKSKRILILSTSYKPLVGGSEIAIEEVTSRLPDYEFDLITARPDKKLPAFEKIGGVNVFRVGNSLGLFHFLLPKNFLPLAIFFKAKKLLSANEYHLIHAFQASQAAAAAWLLKFFYPKLPLVLTMQEGKDLKKQNFLTNLFRNLIIRKADRITAISQYLKNYILEIRKKISVTVIPNGVDVDKFSQEFSYGQLSELADCLGIRPGEKVIVSASRLTFKNGIDSLIKAVGFLHQQNSALEWKLLLVGDGGLKKEMQNLSAGLGIEKKIIFAGTVSHSDLPQYLKIADVFVRPSRTEGLGNSFLEAMVAEVPVIGSSAGGIKDFLTDGETGLVCDPENPEDIARKIERILADESLRKEVVRNAKQLVVEKYDWDKIALEYKKIYS